jgi:hypothetical protein
MHTPHHAGHDAAQIPYVHCPSINRVFVCIEAFNAKLAAVARAFANECSSPKRALQMAALKHSPKIQSA